MKSISNIRIEYKKERPTPLYRIGGNNGIYVSNIVANSFIADKKLIFPIVVEYDGKVQICYLFKKPRDYEGKCYNIYKLKRIGRTCFYIPIPKALMPILMMNDKRRPLLTYTVAINSDKEIMLLLERFS